MKKITSFLLAAVMLLAVTACNETDTAKPADTTGITAVQTTTTAAPEPEIPVSQLKETVSTDIVDLTLEDSKLTYYVSNVSSTYVQPTETANSMFAAKVGTCYVSMTVTVSNKDRGGSLDFCGGFAAWDAGDWSVTYNGEEYEMYGFDLNIVDYDSISLDFGAKVDKETGKVIEKMSTGNDLISAGETVTYRFFGIIKVDPASLNDSFELNVKVPNSKGKFEEFTYQVPEYDPAAHTTTEKQMTLDLALTSFVTEEGRAFFETHMDEYSVVTANEFSAFLLGKWSVDYIKEGIGSWSGDFWFEEGGTIKDTYGYVNERTWRIDGDMLIIDEKYTTEMRKVSDHVYLLISDGKPFMLMQ